MFWGNMRSETKRQTLEENEFYTAHLKSMNTSNVFKNVLYGDKLFYILGKVKFNVFIIGNAS